MTSQVRFPNGLRGVVSNNNPRHNARPQNAYRATIQYLINLQLAHLYVVIYFDSCWGHLDCQTDNIISSRSIYYFESVKMFLTAALRSIVPRYASPVLQHSHFIPHRGCGKEKRI